MEVRRLCSSGFRDKQLWEAWKRMKTVGKPVFDISCLLAQTSVFTNKYC